MVDSATSFFVGGPFFGDSVDLEEEMSGSSSPSDLFQKVLVLVGSPSRNGWIVMLGFDMWNTTLLA